MTEEEEVPPMAIIPMEPKDLCDLYMMARAELSSESSFYRRYLKLLYLIDIGKEMLPAEAESLRREAEMLLTDVNSFPEARQMEITSSGTYRMGTGTSQTGLVEVKQEDISIALDEVKNQQATALIPKMMRLDSRIFRAIIREGIIKVKEPSMEEVMMDEVMFDLQKKVE